MKRSTVNNYAGVAGVKREHPEQRRLTSHSSYIMCFIHSFNKNLLRTLLCDVLKELINYLISLEMKV